MSLAGWLILLFWGFIVLPGPTGLLVIGGTLYLSAAILNSIFRFTKGS